VEQEKRKLHIKLVAIYMSILLLGTFWLTLRMAQEPVNMVIEPAAPRVGEPILVTFKFNNPSSHPLSVHYQFYANGKMLAEGTATVGALSSETYHYSYQNQFAIGEQLIFQVKAHSAQGNFERIVSLPYLPPQIWSSFVSLGAFSSAMMSSSTSIVYYYQLFGMEMGLNVGIIVAIALTILLMFIELSQPVLTSRNMIVLSRLKEKMSSVTWVLLIIVVGIIYSTMIAVIAH
jgi:hypothetical protein